MTPTMTLPYDLAYLIICRFGSGGTTPGPAFRGRRGRVDRTADSRVRVFIVLCGEMGTVGVYIS